MFMKMSTGRISVRFALKPSKRQKHWKRTRIGTVTKRSSNVGCIATKSLFRRLVEGRTRDPSMKFIEMLLKYYALLIKLFFVVENCLISILGPASKFHCMARCGILWNLFNLEKATCSIQTHKFSPQGKASVLRINKNTCALINMNNGLLLKAISTFIYSVQSHFSLSLHLLLNGNQWA